jgi:2-polyprenyl-3-methyl-5-hydroxy-6-metoxy-1,4-benzoquinol methylase
MRAQPSFPHQQFAMVADERRLEAYRAAMRAAIDQMRQQKKRQQQQLEQLEQQEEVGVEDYQGAEGRSPSQMSSQCEFPSVNSAAASAGTMTATLPEAAAASTTITRASTGRETATRAERASVTRPVATPATLGQAAATAAKTAAIMVPDVHVLDVGAGCGVLSLLAVQSGATAVTGVELYGPLAAVARKNAAVNGMGGEVAVVHGDVGQLQRGRDVPEGGVELVVMDMFDAGEGGGC